jgi:hypothetical protein
VSRKKRKCRVIESDEEEDLCANESEQENQTNSPEPVKVRTNKWL